MIAPVMGGGASGRVVSARARELAVRLSALFERDVNIVQRLNDAQRRLRDANERLWSGLSPDAFGLIYDGAAPAGQSEIAALIVDAVGGESQAAVLFALQDSHWTIHRAFCEFQSVSEERRQLAVEVGELSCQLIEALVSAGWSADDAQDADVHELSGAGIR
ncbi:MAG: hypothetical protein ACXVII_40420 [Solirubrobacteraceae bacterium]